MITHQPTKKLSFPKKKSLGVLYYAPATQPEEWQLLTQVRALVTMPENEPIRWELLDEARGEVVIPPQTKLKLKISTDAANLAALEELASDDLHAIDFGHTAVVDHSLIYIQHLTGICFLELASTSIGDHGLSFIQGLHNLHSIGLSYSRITNDGLRNLSKLRQLREIWLSGTVIDDIGVEFFSPLAELVQLGLSSTRVTDAGLLNLSKLLKLLRIYLFNTQVTHNGVQLFKHLLPDCKVKWHPPKIHTQDAEHVLSAISEITNEEKTTPKEKSLFSEDDFWRLIDLLNWQNEGNDKMVIAPAIEALSKLDIADIVQFSEILAQKLYMLDGATYAQEIGTDSYAGSKGDFAKNWFLYVRCCVIANGKDFYLSVIDNPNLMPKDTEFRSLLTLPTQAYKIKTGNRFNHTTEYSYETFSNQILWAGK